MGSQFECLTHVLLRRGGAQGGRAGGLLTLLADLPFHILLFFFQVLLSSQGRLNNSASAREKDARIHAQYLDNIWIGNSITIGYFLYLFGVMHLHLNSSSISWTGV